MYICEYKYSWLAVGKRTSLKNLSNLNISSLHEGTIIMNLTLEFSYLTKNKKLVLFGL